MNVSAEESLWLAFPILLVIIGLVGGIFYLQNQNVDVRSRAAQPTPVITPALLPNTATPQTPEVVCTEIYNPVCSPDQVTYVSPCEANLAGVIKYTSGACLTPTRTPLPLSN